MGSIYRDATLVISAAGARDPDGGLFVAEGKIAPVLHPPFISIEGIAEGTLNMTTIPVSLDKTLAQSGPLSKRARAFQERYFGRRNVSFRAERVSKTCLYNYLGEQGKGDVILHMLRGSYP